MSGRSASPAKDFMEARGWSWSWDLTRLVLPPRKPRLTPFERRAVQAARAAYELQMAVQKRAVHRAEGAAA